MLPPKIVFINPRRACAARVSLSTQHLTSPTFIRATDDITYFTVDEDQKFCAVFSENSPFKDRALFAYRGEVRHFCQPGYNYTRARTFYAKNRENLYACALRVRFSACMYNIAIRVERRGFRTLVLFILNGIEKYFMNV